MQKICGYAGPFLALTLLFTTDNASRHEKKQAQKRLFK
jgi:hypothetical protein